MTEPELSAAVVGGIGDAMRKSPIVAVLVLQMLVIAGLGWLQVSDSRAEREAAAAYAQELHAQLLECHRGER